jgi:hypothetical protein
MSDQEKDQLVVDVLKSYYAQIEERLKNLMAANNLKIEDLVWVQGNPGPRYTNRAIEQFKLTTMGGFVIDQRWLLKKDDFDRLNRSPSET